MRHIIFFDGESYAHLLPLTYTRPVADLRVGILTIREKWMRYLGGQNAAHCSFLTAPHLAEKFPLQVDTDNLLIPGNLLPTPKLVRILQNLRINEVLLSGGEFLGGRLDAHAMSRLMSDEDFEGLSTIELPEHVAFSMIERPWHIFKLNGVELEADFALLTEGRTSAPLSLTNRIFAGERIFVEEGAIVECAVLNAQPGPIYVAAGAEIMEGAMIRGGLALCAGSQIKMGTRIYGPTTIGPGSKVGGEITNSVIWGNSNKGHDGYLGNSVLGEWCNLGADTNNSNLKNNYDEVRVWSHATERFERTGEQFVGLIMGDHSKCGINTMFNTGTVVGVSANIYGHGYPRQFIPSFSWGGMTGFQTYLFEKAAATADRVMMRRNLPLDDVERRLLQAVYEKTASQRV
jgi:UDP-N-acetylglucosamine diphosphorylase/glucosamine-1-phosphate N-acetyltransferase